MKDFYCRLCSDIITTRSLHQQISQSPEVLRTDDRLPASLREGTLSLEALCRYYCTRIYERAGSFAETARRLKIDRRTVKKYVDTEVGESKR